MTSLSKNRSLYVSTVSRAVNLNLNMKSYIRRRRNLLTAKAKAIRIERCPKLLSHLKHKGASKIVDEKKFIVYALVNRHNARLIAIDPSEVPSVFHTKNPASVMVFGAVASDGSVMPPHFVDAGFHFSIYVYYSIRYLGFSLTN